MSKLTVTEAVKVIPVSESTLRRDLKSGKISFETDAKNRKQIDISELTRVYGQLKHQNGTQPQETDTRRDGVAPPAYAEPVNDTHQTPSMNGNETHQNPSITDTDTPKIVDLLENQIADLKAQLAQASDRETALTSEKSKLLDMLSAEQEKTRVLMLPNPEKKRSWLDRLTRR